MVEARSTGTFTRRPRHSFRRPPSTRSVDCPRLPVLIRLLARIPCLALPFRRRQTGTSPRQPRRTRGIRPRRPRRPTTPHGKLLFCSSTGAIWLSSRGTAVVVVAVVVFTSVVVVLPTAFRSVVLTSTALAAVVSETLAAAVSF